MRNTHNLILSFFFITQVSCIYPQRPFKVGSFSFASVVPTGGLAVSLLLSYKPPSQAFQEDARPGFLFPLGSCHFIQALLKDQGTGPFWFLTRQTYLRSAFTLYSSSPEVWHPLGTLVLSARFSAPPAPWEWEKMCLPTEAHYCATVQIKWRAGWISASNRPCAWVPSVCHIVPDGLFWFVVAPESHSPIP